MSRHPYRGVVESSWIDSATQEFKALVLREDGEYILLCGPEAFYRATFFPVRGPSALDGARVKVSRRHVKYRRDIRKISIKA